MSRIFKVQPAAHVDHITEGGVELTRLPYPFFVDEDGMIGRQDRWKGKPFRVVGFQRDLAKLAVDLDWSDAVKDPSRAVGMYLVTADKSDDEDGEETWDTHRLAVAEMVDLSKEPR